jgi:hypothetical protein
MAQLQPIFAPNYRRVVETAAAVRPRTHDVRDDHDVIGP